jgi:hypothetical protein
MLLPAPFGPNIIVIPNELIVSDKLSISLLPDLLKDIERNSIGNN